MALALVRDLREHRAAARLCCSAGADPEAIPAWIEEGRRRRANAGRPPFSELRYRALERVRKGSRAVRYPTGHRRTNPACHRRERRGDIAVLGIIGTGFAYVLNYQIITSEGATVASTVT